MAHQLSVSDSIMKIIKHENINMALISALWQTSQSRFAQQSALARWRAAAYRGARHQQTRGASASAAAGVSGSNIAAISRQHGGVWRRTIKISRGIARRMANNNGAGNAGAAPRASRSMRAYRATRRQHQCG